jgi:hypothetical protein
MLSKHFSYLPRVCFGEATVRNRRLVRKVLLVILPMTTRPRDVTAYLRRSFVRSFVSLARLNFLTNIARSPLLTPSDLLVLHFDTMAEAAAAAYTVETVAEGAAIGAVAVAKSTVPVVIRFHKIKSPSPDLAVTEHSLNYYKGRAYVFGGDREDGSSSNAMQVITLPANLDAIDVDYQAIEAHIASQRPLASYSDRSEEAGEKEMDSQIPQARSAHASAAVDGTIFVFGGRKPRQASSSGKMNLLDEDGTVHAFSAIDNRWTTLRPRHALCTSGVPQPRVNASMTSSTHPKALGDVDSLGNSHGTLFLHGGCDENGRLLRDTWSFDVYSRMWARLPDLPEPGVEEVAGDGRIFCAESRLWRVGDGFGKIAYLDLSRDVVDDFSGKAEIGITPKTGHWEAFSFGQTAQAGETSQNQTASTKGPTSRADELPIPRKGAGFLPITTGAGREFMLYFMGEDAPDSTVDDMWTFQLVSDRKSPAVVKDKIRAAVGAETGLHRWARCDVVQHSKQAGEMERPTALSGFATTAWTDFGGGAVVMWGGCSRGAGVANEGWVLTVD